MMIIVLLIIMSLLLFWLIIGAIVFFMACSKGKPVDWVDDTSIAHTPYKEYGDMIRRSHKWLVDHNAQDVWITSEDGLKLHGYWVPAKNPRGTMLFAHGYHSTMLLDFGIAFPLYHEQGMNILAVSQRSHGKSQGRFVTFGVKESRDMLSWLDHHNKALGGGPVICSGMSMGASTMMYLADEKLPDNVKGMIVDCGFSSPAVIVGREFRKKMHISEFPWIWAADLHARIFAGFSLFAKDSRKTLAQNKLPIFMIHGLDDHFVPCDMTKEAYAVCTGKKQIMLVEGAGHGTSFLRQSQEYSKRIKAFLNENLEVTL